MKFWKKMENPVHKNSTLNTQILTLSHTHTHTHTHTGRHTHAHTHTHTYTRKQNKQYCLFCLDNVHVVRVQIMPKDTQI